MLSKRLENFWYYYKWHVLIGIGALLLIATLASNFIKAQHKPDYTVGLLTRESVSGALIDDLEAQLSTVLDDRNGDGTCEVEIMPYVLEHGSSEERSTDSYFNQSSSIVQFMGDYQTYRCMLYLCNDVAYFEELFDVFAYNDGSAPEEGNVDYEALGLAWGDSDVLSNLDLAPFRLNGETVDAELFMRNFKLLLRAPSPKDKFTEKDERYYADAYRAFSNLF